MKKLAIGIAVLAVALTATTAGFAQVKVDEKLPEYKPVKGVSGSLKSVGSDTMNNEMTFVGRGLPAVLPERQD